MGRMTAWHLVGALLLGAATLADPAAAQAPDTLVTPGPGYAAGGFHRWLFGSHYRNLWTTPVRVPPSLLAALGLTTVATLAFGIFPGLVTHFTGISDTLTAATGG